MTAWGSCCSTSCWARCWDCPLDLISTALPKVLYRMGKVNRRQGNFLYIPMDALFTMAAFWLADQWLGSVSTTGLSLCILGFGSALATLPIPKEV